MIDQKALDVVAGCWVKFRRVQSVEELDEDCRSVICALLLRIAQDDPTWRDDPELSEDIAICSKAGPDPPVRTGEL